LNPGISKFMGEDQVSLAEAGGEKDQIIEVRRCPAIPLVIATETSGPHRFATFNHGLAGRKRSCCILA
jgi:hypothetical protein